MSTTLYSKVSALKAQRFLNKHSDEISKSFERLSSGLRINRASDDAAGLAVSETLKTRDRIYNQAVRNVNDGISSLNVADGALTEMTNIVTRLKELASEAANGVYNVQQRKALDAEAYALTDEYNRILQTTEFNQTQLLGASQGTTRIQGGIGVASSIGYILGNEMSQTIGDGTFGSGINYGNYSYVSYIGDVNSDG